MELPNQNRAVLAQELSVGSFHTPDEIEKVLSAFIDPSNPEMIPDHFFKEIVDLALQCQADMVDPYLANVQKVLLDIFDNVKNARLFNETYIGHMLSEASIPGMLAYILAIRLGSNTVAREVSIFESELEIEAIRGLIELVGYDPKLASGTFTSGGSLANITALAVARKLYKEKDNCKTPVRVLTSPFAHYSISKACDLLGGVSEQIELVKVEPQKFRMSISDLKSKVYSSNKDEVPILAIIAIAGETETGLVDSLDEIADIADENNILLMADGAYGAPYRLSCVAGKFHGLDRAFAITLDPHKALYTPYSNGAVLFRKAEDHARLAWKINAPYLQFTKDLPEIVENIRYGKGNHGQKRIEGSMGAGPILSTLAVLRTLGLDGLGVLYDLTIDRTEYLYRRITASKFLDAIHEPDLNLLCFTLKRDVVRNLGITSNIELGKFIERTRKQLDKDIQKSGGYFFSATDLPIDLERTYYVYRACIMNPRTTNTVLDNAVSELEGIIDEELRNVRI